jgi:hypothetical protein
VTVPPQPGDLLIVDGRASVQFAGDRALLLRVTTVSTAPTYHGWIWLTGYVVDQSGHATDKREVYVQLAGLRRAAVAKVPTQRRRNQARTGPRPRRNAEATRIST